MNGYQFLEQIGVGGFAIVYRAVQPALGRDVAIKIILPAYANHPDFVRRFEQEARLIARLEHPHIVPLYDYWQDENGAFLVMRWLPKTLRAKLQEAPFSLADAARVLDQIASALHTAHRSGVIHRDIKPDNLLLDVEGNVYLADFGIAKAENAELITADGQIVGSMAYIAPEQISGKPLTPQADIYSLGLVLYELLTGSPPYAGSSLSEFVYHHIHDPLPSIHVHKPDLPGALDAVLAMATAKQPAERYPDALHFARAFRAALPAPRKLQPLADPLTERELETLHLMAEGLTNSEIAERLYVTPSTVKWYKKQIYSKLDVHTQDLAIAYAQTMGLLETHSSQPVSQPPPERTVISAVLSLPTVIRLPTQTTPFIGRETEITSLSALLRDSQNRLITILAPGGMGKTRLALEVAAQLAPDFTHGVTFIALNAVSELGQVVPAIANVLGIALSGQMEPKQQLLEHFRTQQQLLILDNFEHLLEAAPLLMDILGAAPQVKILTTTRERLNLSAETLFPLGGMSMPETSSTADPLSYAAVRLFVGAASHSHASAYTPAELAEVGQICRLVQGMPLALLLAASWSDLLTVSEIVAELSHGIDLLENQWRDLPERQRSIRAVFAASWNRLTHSEADVLMRLSVFRSGFKRQAAEEVAGASLRTLSGLINKAMLWMDQEGRCSIHELLRQYAAERLEAAELRPAVCAAHSTYYLGMLAAHETELIGHNQVIALHLIGSDFENVRAACLWGIAEHEFAQLAPAVHPLWLYAHYSGRYADIENLLSSLAESLRQQPPDPRRDELLGSVLIHQAYLLISMIDRSQADQCLAEALPLVEASGNSRLRAFYHLTCAVWLPWEDFRASIQHGREALALYQEANDGWGQAMAALAIANSQFGDEHPDAEISEALQVALSLLENIGDPFTYSRALTQLAFASPVDEVEQAPARFALLEQVVELRRHTNPTAFANALDNLAMMKTTYGRLTEAAQDGETLVAVRRAQGNIRNVIGFDVLGQIYLYLGRLSEAADILQEGFSYADRTEQPLWRNVFGMYLAEVAYAAGDYNRAEALASEMLEENTGKPASDVQGSLTYILAIAGLAALARGDFPLARRWCDQAVLANQTDTTRNGIMFVQIVLGLIALKVGVINAAQDQLRAGMVYFRDEYQTGVMEYVDRDFGLALALTGASCAAVRSGDSAAAADFLSQAVHHAIRLNVTAYALMTLIPAAEIAIAVSNADQAARLAGLAARHPHTFAADRAAAELLLKQLPDVPDDESDLWELVEEWVESFDS